MTSVAIVSENRQYVTIEAYAVSGNDAHSAAYGEHPKCNARTDRIEPSPRACHVGQGGQHQIVPIVAASLPEISPSWPGNRSRLAIAAIVTTRRHHAASSGQLNLLRF